MRPFHILSLLAGAGVLVLATIGYGQGETRELRMGERGETRSTPFLTGVAVHFGIGGEYGYDPQRTAEKVRELGFDSYRDDLPWSLFTDPTQGPLGERPKRLYDFMELRPARPILILGHPNDKVPGGSPPIEAPAQDAFARYTADAVEAMAPFDPIYEIWNEWNMNAVRGRPWLKGAGPADDPRAAVHYTGLARRSVAAIRAVRPDAEILVGAVGVDEDWAWTKAIVEGGALEGADALSVHLYNHCERDVSKRTATEMVDRMETLQAFLTQWNGGRPYPVAVTEYGWPSIETQCVIPLQAASDNSAQFMLWAAAQPWVTGAWVYQLKQSLLDPKDLESGFGLFDYNYGGRPAACAMKETIALIHGATAMRLERPLDNLFLLQLDGPEGRKLVAWASDADRAGSLRFSDGAPRRSRPLCGQPGEGAQIAVGPTPVVIDLASDGAYDMEVTGR